MLLSRYAISSEIPLYTTIVVECIKSLLSEEPIYMVPSLLIVGVAQAAREVSYFQIFDPSKSIEYILLS